MLFLATSTSATNSSLSAAAVCPQQGSQFDPDANVLGAPPTLRNPGIDNMIGPETAAPQSSAHVPSRTGTQINTKGELVQDTSNSTAILLEREKSEVVAAPDSFLISYWPYLLVAVALAGWVIAQLCKSPEPSFKHTTILNKDHLIKDQSTKDQDGGPKVSGQFKVSQRFQKTKIEDEKATEETSLPEPEPVKQQTVHARKDGRPTDDEFDLGLEVGCSDSDIIDEQDAAEIIKRVDMRQTELRGPRFKTGVEQSKASSPDSK